MVRWTLKRGADRRFREGHPWVFSNELSASPKGIMPGSTVELFDSQGNFLARGYGHPNSLIAFREITRDPLVSDPFDIPYLASRLQKAARLREELGFAGVSYRLCFGEADGFPGLIIDRYVVGVGQVFVLQAQTAGMDCNIIRFVEALKLLSAESWTHTGVVVKNDSKMRALEGLKPEEGRVEKSVEGWDFHNLTIAVRSARRAEPVQFTVDLVGGQKTGFFLDQSANIDLLAKIVTDQHNSTKNNEYKVLDLCSYVGQWSTQIARVVTALGSKAHFVMVDASDQALAMARINVERAGGTVETVRGDVLKDLARFTTREFDLVVCDPPAFIKGRKDLGPGQHAYMKLNESAMRLVKEHGIYISCSCSGLLTESDFQLMLAKAARRADRSFFWIAKGLQSADHPVRLNFPEGSYLKSWFAISAN